MAQSDMTHPGLAMRPRAGRRGFFSGSPLVAPAWELGTLAALILFYLGAEELLARDSIDVRNYVGPFVLMTALALGALRMVLVEAASIWLALFWFRASAAVYYGAGALVPLLANDETRLYLEAYFPFNDELLAKANLVWALGIFIVLVTSSVFVSVRQRTSMNSEAAPRASDGRAMQIAGLALLVVGGVLKYFFIMPNMFGLLSYTLPGAISILSSCSFAAMFFLTAWSLEHGRSSFGFVIAFLMIEMLIGFLMMTKHEVLMPLIMFLLAFIRQKVTPARLAAVGAAIVAVYVTIIPVVDYGRQALLDRYRTNVGVGFDVRLEIIQKGLEGEAWNTISTSNAQAGWVRISYANQSTFAIHLYDLGQPSNSLEHLFAVFIPRFLWPDKPNITDTWLEFNLMATGNPNSASSPGLFAEAYWIAGWPGVVLLMIPVGIIMALFSQVAIDVMRKEQWLYFPVVLMAMRSGLRTDGHFVADMVGGTVIVVCAYILFTLFERNVLVFLLRRRQGTARAVAAGRSGK